MGIDVWRRRPPRSAKPESVAAMASDVQGAGVERAVGGGSSIESVRQSLGRTATVAGSPELIEAPVMPVPVVASEPSFLLIFADFPGVTFVSLYSADLARLPDHHQHFLSSLYFALSGNKSAAKVTDFRWPMVKSKHISQSQEEAKQVLGQSLNGLAGQILVLGRDAADLLPHVAVADYETTVLTGTVAGKTVWMLPELEHFFTQPKERKKLWQWLGGLRETLKGE